MLLSLALAISVASLTSGSVMRRQSPGFQAVPTTGKADNTFNNGAPMLAAEPNDTDIVPPAIYGARDIDLPFGRLFHGNAMFFPAGQLNTPTENSDKWYPEGADSANQSACGIPDNAYSISKVAIHPYFLKYADLSRYCMQDVCISFWKDDGSSDMMLKVTDICSTDSNDPTSCATPADIKIDRTKAQIMEGLTANPLASYPQLTGDKFPDQIWWFFAKCWDDGLPQPAYQGNNWFTTPELPNNRNWSLDTDHTQWQNNQNSYASKGWPLYDNGAYAVNRVMDPLNDWAPGDATPAWEPVAGGKGWGVPNADGAAAGTAAASSAVAVNVKAAVTSASASAPAPAATTSSVQGSGQGGAQSASPVAPTSAAAASGAPPSTPSESGDQTEQDDCDSEL